MEKQTIMKEQCAFMDRQAIKSAPNQRQWADAWELNMKWVALEHSVSPYVYFILGSPHVSSTSHRRHPSDFELTKTATAP